MTFKLKVKGIGLFCVSGWAAVVFGDAAAQQHRGAMWESKAVSRRHIFQGPVASPPIKGMSLPWFVLKRWWWRHGLWSHTVPRHCVADTGGPWFGAHFWHMLIFLQLSQEQVVCSRTRAPAWARGGDRVSRLHCFRSCHHPHFTLQAHGVGSSALPALPCPLLLLFYIFVSSPVLPSLKSRGKYLQKNLKGT